MVWQAFKSMEDGLLLVERYEIFILFPGQRPSMHVTTGWWSAEAE